MTRKSTSTLSTAIAAISMLSGCAEGSLNRDLRLWQYYRVVGDTRLAAKQKPPAESAYLNALKLAQQLNNDMRIAISYKRLAAVSVDMGSLEKAKSNYEAAIKHYRLAHDSAENAAEKTLLQEELLECFMSLGDIEAKQKDYKGAERLYQDAITGYEVLATREAAQLDISILFRWSQATKALAKLFRTNGNEVESRTVIDRFFSKSKRNNVPQTIKDNLEMDVVLSGSSTGHDTTSATAARRSIEASRNWMLSYSTGREYLYKRKDYVSAEQCFRKAIAAAQSFPKLDAREGLAWKELGMVFSARQDLPNAVTYFKKSLSILKQTSSKANTDWLDTEFGLVAILNKIGKSEEAAKQGEILTEDLVAIEGADSPRVAAAAKNVGFMYATVNNWSMAEKQFARANKVYQNDPTCPPGEQAQVLANLALAQVHQNKLPAAKINVDKAIKYLEQPGATRESRQLVIDLYRLLDKRLKRK